jgi:hypothetical protein
MREQRIVSTIIATMWALTLAATLSACSTGRAPGHWNGFDRTLVAQWSVALPGTWKPVKSAQVVGGVVVLHTADGIAALDRTTGITRWHLVDPGAGPVTVAGDTVVVKLMSGTVEVLDAASGAPHYAYEHAHAYAVTLAALVVVDCTPQTQACTAIGLDPHTGETRWTRPLSGAPDVLAEPADGLRAADGTSVLLTDVGGTVALDTRHGTPGPQLPPVPLGSAVRLLGPSRYVYWDPTQCSPLVHAVDTATGAEAWSLRTGTRPCTEPWQPDVVGGTLLTSTADGRPVLVGLDSGAMSYPAGAGSVLVAATGAEAYVHDPGGTLSAITRPDLRTLWTHALPTGLDPAFGVTDRVVAYAGTGSPCSLTLLDARTGTGWVAAGENQLFGIGDGWAVGGTGGPGSARTTPLEVRLFKT